MCLCVFVATVLRSEKMLLQPTIFKEISVYLAIYVCLANSQKRLPVACVIFGALWEGSFSVLNGLLFYFLFFLCLQ